MVHLYASLPESFIILVTALEAISEDPKMEVVTKHLHEKRKMMDGAAGNMSSENAMTTNHHRTVPLRCHLCKKLRHIQGYCTGETTSGEKLPPQDTKRRKYRHKANPITATKESKSDCDAIVLALNLILSVGESSKRSRNGIVDCGATCHI
uniref:Uncharacterized protein n=1 Tax=Amphimedon queenslandica TaxID=400682 RepID=A0A1X7U467_AMPQE